MGMFDYLRCEFPLPLQGANELEFQTKDTDAQYCDQYVIRADGTLWHQDYDTEDRSDPKAEGLAALIGSRTSVNHRWEQDFMTGSVNFYSYDEKRDPDWISFVALFARGKLMHMEQISPPPATAPQEGAKP